MIRIAGLHIVHISKRLKQLFAVHVLMRMRLVQSGEAFEIETLNAPLNTISKAHHDCIPVHIFKSSEVKVKFVYNVVFSAALFIISSDALKVLDTTLCRCTCP